MMEGKKHLCPVCGKYEFEDEYEKCGVCGWWNDLVQELHPDFDAGANAISLNQAKDYYKKGRMDLIRMHQPYDKDAERLNEIDAVIAGLTVDEMRYMGRRMSDRIFHATRPAVEQLKYLLPKMKNTQTDGAEADEIRMRIIKKLDGII